MFGVQTIYSGRYYERLIYAVKYAKKSKYGLRIQRYDCKVDGLYRGTTTVAVFHIARDNVRSICATVLVSQMY